MSKRREAPTALLKKDTSVWIWNKGNGRRGTEEMEVDSISAEVYVQTVSVACQKMLCVRKKRNAVWEKWPVTNCPEDFS